MSNRGVAARVVTAAVTVRESQFNGMVGMIDPP